MIEKLWSEMVQLIHAGHGDRARAVFDEAMKLAARQTVDINEVGPAAGEPVTGCIDPDAPHR